MFTVVGLRFQSAQEKKTTLETLQQEFSKRLVECRDTAHAKHGLLLATDSGGGS